MRDPTIASGKLGKAYVKGRRGQALVEYALILAFISVVAVASLTVMSGNIGNLYGMINSRLSAALAPIIH